jgi:hypothetical protein
MAEALRAAEIDEAIGPHDFDQSRYRNLDDLADRLSSAHWHVNDLPWNELPPLPLPDVVDARRRRSFIEFGKRAIHVQLAAEHVAVTASHALLQHAEASGLHPSVKRGLAAVMNDEASHVQVMIELQARADRAYPDVTVERTESPLFAAFVDAIPRLHPAVVSIFMGAYEAMIAIRAYAEEAAYRHPSILGRMAGLAAHDDALHAKVLRLVSHVLIDEVRKDVADPALYAATMQSMIIEPLGDFWPLLIEHEKFLLHGDDRFRAECDRRVAADAAIVKRFLTLLGLNPPELRENPAARD